MVYNPYHPKVNAQVARGSGTKATPERLKILAENRRIPRVRVVPARESLRRILKHPNGMAFRREGSVEWPLDNFTHRRLRDGDIMIVSTVGAAPAAAPAPAKPSARPSSRQNTTSSGGTAS